MKSIELKAAKETITFRTPQGTSRQELLLNGAKILFDIVNEPIEGFNVKKMMQRLRIAEPLEEAMKHFELPPNTFTNEIPNEYFQKTYILQLEDADYEELKKLCENFEFGFVSKFIVELVNSFN